MLKIVTLASGSFFACIASDNGMRKFAHSVIYSNASRLPLKPRLFLIFHNYPFVDAQCDLSNHHRVTNMYMRDTVKVEYILYRDVGCSRILSSRFIYKFY